MRGAAAAGPHALSGRRSCAQSQLGRGVASAPSAPRPCRRASSSLLALGASGSRSGRAHSVRRLSPQREAAPSGSSEQQQQTVVRSAAAGSAVAGAPAIRRRVRRGGSDGTTHSSNGGSGSSTAAMAAALLLPPVVAAGSAQADEPAAGAAAAASSSSVVRARSRTQATAASVATAAAQVLPHLSGSSNGSSAAVQQLSHLDGPPREAAAADAATDASAAAADAAAEAAALHEELKQASCVQDVLDVVSDEADAFLPGHTLAALSRLAKMGRALPRPQRLALLGDDAFIALLGQLYQQAVSGALGPFELSNCIYSCGVLQVPLEHLRTSSKGEARTQLLDALESSLAAQVGAFNDRDVSSTLYGYAQLGLRRQPSVAVISKLTSRAQSLMDQGKCSPRCTSMILWALATLFGSSSSGSSGSRHQQHSSSSSSSSSPGGAPAAAMAAAAGRQLEDPGLSFDAVGAQGVANSLWGMAKLGCHNQRVLEKACEWLAANLAKCKMQEVLNILWAAGAGRHRPLQLARIVGHVAAHAEALKPADMASLFHVLGLFGFDFEAKPELLAALLPRAEALLPNMKPFEVTSLYWGLGMTRQVTSSLFANLTAIVRRLQQQQSAAQARLQELQEQHAQQQPQQAAGDGDGDAVSQPEQQQQQQQQRRGGKQQQLPQTPEVAQLQARARQLPDSLQRQAFQAFIAARMEGAPVELPVDVLSALQSAWLATSRHSGGSGGSSSYARGGRALQPLLLELEWLLGALRIKARVGVRSKLDKLVPVDVELLASGQRFVALQVLDEHEVARDGTRLATVAWEEDVLRRNGYDDVHWLRVADYKRVPKERRPRYIGDLLRKLGISPQERLLAAAERAWLEAGCKPTGGSGSGGAGGSWGDKVGAGGISAAEADVLMQGGSGGGWATGGRGTRSRRGSPPSSSGKRR